MKTTMNSKAIIYCRVSSREQEETGYSLDSQEKLLKEYAERKEFKVDTRVFKVAESASGKQIRKTFSEMLLHAEKNDIKIILCEKIDRLTRNLKDAATANDWVQTDETREIHFVKENFVVSKNTKAHENFVWDMKVAIARFYTNNLSEEVKKGQKEKLAQGWLPTKPPIGYKTVGDKGRKIHVLDGEKATLIKQAFQLYATGNYSLAALKDMLFDRGLRTRGGAQLSKSRLDDILRDPFYYGAMRWNDAVYARGAQEPLVSKEVFEKVQDILSGRKAPHFKRRYFQFRKMLTCGECGGTITAEIKKGQYIYYHCNHFKKCSQKGGTPEKVIENQLFGVFNFFESITPKEAEELKNRIKANHSQETEYKETAIRTLTERYSTLQRRLDNLYNDRLDERITRELWEKKNKEITDEQAGIQEQLTRLKGEEARYFEIWTNMIDLARRAREIYNKRSPEERRLLLSHLFSTLKLKDGAVEPTYKKSTAAIAKRVQERLDAAKSLERTQKAAKGGSLRGVPVKKPIGRFVESSELLKDFRTSENPLSTVRFGDSDSKSGSLLRG